MFYTYKSGQRVVLPISLTLLAAALIMNPSLQAHAQSSEPSSKQEDRLKVRWEQFQANPSGFLNSHPVKRDQRGRVIPSVANSVFSASDIESQEFVLKKAEGASSVGRNQIPSSRRASHFAGEGQIKTKILSFLDQTEFQAKGITPLFRLQEMEDRKLQSAQLDETPWSGSYWPIYQGSLGARYASASFLRGGGNWKKYFGSVGGPDTLSNIVSRGDAHEIDELSPSEKYDLLIGVPGEERDSQSGYLTPLMWAEGQRYYDQFGRVESWMGLCHGWAPASFMAKRPRRIVQATAANESSQVRFYPSDLKGLSTLLWTSETVATTFIGGRCNAKKPKLDPKTGRIIDSVCFDTNPGVWHLALINQIGQAKRSMVIDATYDYEVWNQPVYSYTYRYFNPQTGESTDTLAKAAIARADFSKDKFAKYRSKETATIVGVEMDLSYVSESGADHQETDSPDEDVVQTVTYLYDLELNAEGEIIGGEWYHNAHPDFLWLPAHDAQALSYGDMELNGGAAWTPSQALPRFWRDLAVKTATNFGQPLAAIVEPLLTEASEPAR